MTRTTRFAAATLLTGLATGLAGCATTGEMSARSDTLSLGRNGAGEPCQAVRTWRDEAVTDMFDESYAISCRNVSASRALGFARVVGAGEGRAKVEATLRCGAARPVAVPRFGAASARQCFDSALDAPSIVLEGTRGGRSYIVSAVSAASGPAEEALRILAGLQRATGDPRRETTSAIDLATLAAAPGASEEAVEEAETTAGFDPSLALAQGIGFNHKGLHVEASRVLNDALSRVEADTPANVRAELLLEAALADSNIRFDEAAGEHFARADEMMAANSELRTPFLERKRDAYHALDLLNRRQFRGALVALAKLTSAPAAADQPLQNPALIRALNQPGVEGNTAASSVSVPDTRVLQQLVIDAQAHWARSVAMLALGDLAGADAALTAATTAYAPLTNERIDQVPVLWLGARIERQRGRLAARRGDYAVAVGAFDRALDLLRRSAIATAGTGNEPSVAETQIERAGIVARSGASAEVIRADYDAAIDALIAASRSGGGILPVGVESYLDLLVAEAASGLRPDTYERYFKAMQAVGEPAVARQLSQLQTVVTADPEIGVKVRDRAELEREITRLRYAIAANDGTVPLGVLERQRQDAESRLIVIDNELSADRRFRTIDDSPATIAEIRAALKPGEVFLKVNELNRRAYGLAVTADKTFVYPLALPVAEIDKLATSVRASIDGRLGEGVLVPYRAEEAYALFRLITGPAADTVMASRALVIDPAGPLERIPAAVLVTDLESARNRPSSFDFTGVQFLAKRLTVSTAVSPRSFLVARSLPPSAARQPFLGFAEHVAPDGGAARTVNVGEGCSVPFAELAALARQLRPIQRKEIAIASSALGVPNAPEIVGSSFTDTAVAGRSDLDQFEVLHFATHGLEEGVWGCDKSPPALVTSFGDADSDGLLSFDEIARLRLDANLVVLSACDTASGVQDEALARRSGQEEAGQTLEGLVRAFLTANSRAVLATFWQVSAEQETDEFIRTFYASARARDIGGALQQAQGALMAQPQYSHPFYWGPYFVVGDSSKMMLSGAARTASVGDAAQPAARN